MKQYKASNDQFSQDLDLPPKIKELMTLGRKKCIKCGGSFKRKTIVMKTLLKLQERHFCPVFNGHLTIEVTYKIKRNGMKKSQISAIASTFGRLGGDKG